MKKNKWLIASKFIYLILFLTIEVFLYASFIMKDFGASIEIDSSKYKYGSIILVVLFFFLSFIIDLILERKDKNHSKRVRFDMIIVGTALIFTLVSDTFLLYLNKYYELGLSSFIIVQALYFFRLIYGFNIKGKRLYTSLIIRGSIIVSICVVLLIMNQFSILYFLTAIYFVNIVLNFIDSLLLTIENRSDERFRTLMFNTIGLLLFVGCDICVGLSNLNGSAGELIWIFYLPSQILISLSAVKMFNKTMGGLYDDGKKEIN